MRASDNHASFHEILNDKTNLAATTMSSDYNALRPSTNRSNSHSHSQTAFNSNDHQNLQNNGKQSFGGNSTSVMRGSATLSMSMTIPSNHSNQPSNVMDANTSSGSGSSGQGGMGVKGGYIDMQARNDKRGPVTPKPFLRKGSRKVSMSFSSYKPYPRQPVSRN